MSELKNKNYEFSKITARPFKSKKGFMWQLEKSKNNQVFHENMSEEDFFSWLSSEGRETFRQVCLTGEGVTVHYTVFPDKVKRKETGNALKVSTQSHNKEKSYILKQGENIPALVDLGVFSKELTRVAAYQQTVDLQLADLGARSKRLTLTKSRLTEQNTTFSDLKSKNEDAELEDTIIKYSAASTLYEAALTAASDCVKQSLINYI